MSLLEALDGARLVVVDEDRQLAHAWFGGAGVNTYDAEGREVGYFTVGANGPVTAEIAERSIRRVMAADDAED